MNVLPPIGSTLRHAVLAINQLIQGRGNAASEVTLTAGAATTIVESEIYNAGAKVFLFPKTASAAAEVTTTYAEVTEAGTVTITHANNATTDRTFNMLVQGG